MDDLVLKSIRDGTQYEELPDRVQQALSFKGWQERCVYPRDVPKICSKATSRASVVCVQGESSMYPSGTALERLASHIGLPRVRVLRTAPEDVQNETEGVSVPHGSRDLWEVASDSIQVLP